MRKSRRRLRQIGAFERVAERREVRGVRRCALGLHMPEKMNLLLIIEAILQCAVCLRKRVFALKGADLPQAETALAHVFDTQRRQHAPEAQVKETAMMVMHTCRSTLEAFGADLDAVDLDRAEWKRQLQQLQFHQDCIRHQKQLVRAVCQYLALLSTEGGNLLADVQNYMDMHFCSRR